MITKIFPDNPNPRVIADVVRQLRDGALMIYPTDTLYALGCDALNVRAVERICAIKGINPAKANLSIVCAEFKDVSRYATMSDENFKMMRRYLPGAFTFILPASSSLPKIYKHRKCVGIRIPDNAIATAIVRELGNPLLSTSLPVDDYEPEYAADPELIDERYSHQVDFVIDGGYGSIIPSTVLDCTGNEPELIRQGVGEL